MAERIRTSAPRPRVAITTDWLTSLGGAERVLQELHGMYPDAPIFTSVFDPGCLTPELREWDVRPSPLQHVPLPRRYSRALLPLMPMAFRRFDFRDYDVVISASSAFSKNVTTGPNTANLCYCFTPPRYLWGMTEAYLGGLKRAAARGILKWLRARDLEAAGRVDDFVAISRTVAGRIRATYERDASVVYPPVDTRKLHPSGSPPDDFYLVVSRLVPYKRVDIAIEACNRLGRRLIVVGVGPEGGRLAALAGPTVELVGRLPDSEIVDLYARCRAFLFPGLEDFGIAPVEAQAAGRPVVAFGQGGATETVVHGETGLLVAEQSAEAFVAALEQPERGSFDPQRCRDNAKRFDSSIFRAEMGRHVALAAMRAVEGR